MSIEKVRAFLKERQLDDKIQEFDVSSATVELATQALSVDGRRIAKTLSFLLGERCILIVAAGDAKVDNRKFKDRFAAKAKMLPHDEVPAYTGHAVGGVCPFAVNPGIDIFLDESLRRFDTVYPACGSSNSAIKLTIAQLENLSGYTDWVDVCKDWQPEA